MYLCRKDRAECSPKEKEPSTQSFYAVPMKKSFLASQLISRDGLSQAEVVGKPFDAVECDGLFEDWIYLVESRLVASQLGDGVNQADLCDDTDREDFGGVVCGGQKSGAKYW